MTTRTCPQCERDFDPKRPHQIYDTEECSYQGWVQKQVEDAYQRVEAGVGGRGGNVRGLDQARGLQEEQKEKARWTLIVREHIARTLLETGFFHADDLDALGVPPTHCNVKGSQIGSFRSRGLMEKTGQERKVSHVAANGRKAPIYRISAKGRESLSKMLAGVGGGFAATGSPPSGAATGHAPHSGEQRTAGVGAGTSIATPARVEDHRPMPTAEDGPGGTSADPGETSGAMAEVGSPAGASSPGAPEAARLFEPAPAAPSAYDPFSEAA